MKKHIKRLSKLILFVTLISLLVSNLNNNKIAETYKAEANGMYKDFYLEKGDTLTLYIDNSYEIVNSNGILVNKE